ncbi:helix-turn-helix domain-containing protein [Streptomyces sp. WAC05374]|uniref:helix-turn-helix domain-containing protein n=1 Tax=Streptomyces sp. WAC05374 TaxID=2487420 RepID=UPI000F8732D8|nr:helix-turn-helix domain-containing protein [Streptomyces sp. WAC05374]RST13446.1 helix-turn-helix domain-containing protein [Streptomyces sp. WAC05374]TDF48422.1 helix-turn-helix domain-containing protein [Streptomyces sp. WAC05374]TDF55022.1 helix-turn-helix domain-containing protein [Streptomyces sp. WAC05374]TDF55356.1 helix-turn-helix domain-containing protein [Streptomyces sp. WAC05374]
MNLHGTAVRQQALTLLRGGARNADVARRLDLPPGTVAYWLHMDRSKRGECPGRHHPECPRCHGRDLDASAYSYLLGLYLGDGHISHYSAHRVPNLMITCDETWPGLMDDCEKAMRTVFPGNAVCRVRRTGCRNVKVYSKHLECLFPQHGPGKKHERRIVLEAWQQRIVDEHPWEFVRGLIHSDGCRITNWTTRLVGGVRKRYEYPRYFFSNKSDDIRQLFTDALDKVGVEWTTLARSGNPYNISVARRASVGLMDAHVGPKY